MRERGDGCGAPFSHDNPSPLTTTETGFLILLACGPRSSGIVALGNRNQPECGTTDGKRGNEHAQYEMDAGP